ncbi:DoxX family protein [Sinomicrobium kalidii]|uniref:DoxX family protein n=1 Tax=Sinomicrobium kalidii TaxID=2900738 RepID=UPI001E2E5121|nr:DoxX family protein [Sinomicrobium kalidii]UGU16580.1 DoxX family protein [Sinomicrobium kalidii]
MNMLYKTGYIPYAGALGVLVLRVSLSVFLLAGHGFEKWNMLFSGDRVDFPDLFGLCPELTLGLVTFAEVICSILVAIGLLTKMGGNPTDMLHVRCCFFHIWRRR